MKLKIALISAVLLFLAASAQAFEPKPGDPVNEVRIRGNLRVETEKVMSVLGTVKGGKYDPDMIRRDISAIYSLGYFADVIVEYDEEGKVTFVVLERPSVRKWELQENDVIKQDDLKDKVKIDPAEILHEGQAEDAVKTIKQLFMEKGYYLARVDYELTPVEGSKNQVDLLFHAEPREKVRIRHINVAGASDQDSEKLKKNMALSERSIWSWITDTASFKRPELARDAEWVRYYYLNKGYAQVDVGDPIVQVAQDLKNIEITIQVTTGRVYNLGAITFVGAEDRTREELLKTSELIPGALFSADSMRNAVEKIEALYADHGYAYARANPRPKRFTDDGLVDMEFYIVKGEIYHIGRIEASGNNYTRDRVIRRDIKLAEGDLYNRSELRRSDRALKRAGFFKNVSINETKRDDVKLVDLTVDVEETMTGSFSAGAGYSSADGAMLMGSISKANLFGYGYQAKADVALSQKKQSYSITFNNPRIFDSPIYTGFDVYRTSTKYSEYEKFSVGFDLKLGSMITDDWSVRLTYAWDHSDLTGVCTYDEYARGECSYPASVLVQEQAGKLITSSITPMISYDSRDNYLDPVSGHYTYATVEYAGGVLGGDAAFLKYNLDSRQHIPIFGVTSFMVRGRAGLLRRIEGKPIPVYERFALGGINTIRGLDSRSVGPLDPGEIDPATGKVIRPSSGEVIGGTKMAVFNTEYVFPIFDELKIKGVAFYDAGNAWDENQDWFQTKLRDSAGFGIRWFSPVGPLRLEYGYNLHPKENEKRAQWEFTIGGYF